MQEPHNLDGERAVLGAVLLRASAFDEIGPALSAEDFYLPAHRAVWEAFKRLKARQAAIDVVTVELELGRDVIRNLEGGAGYLVGLAERTPAAANATWYAQGIRALASRRRLSATCRELAARAEGDEIDTPELLEEAQKLIFQVTTGGRPLRAEPVGAALVPALDAIEARQLDGQGVGFPVGLRVLDDVLGRLQPGNVVIVAGRPGMGKTAFALNVVLRAGLLGLPSLFFSMEMSRQDLVERMLAFMSGTPVQRIHAASPRNKLTGPEWIGLVSAQAKLAPLPVEIRAGVGLRLGELVAEARRWRTRHDGAALVVVDYVQLLRPDRRERGQTREEVVSEISRALKALGGELGVAVLALCQLNREVEKDERRPKLSDLRDSGSLEQDADAVLFIHRDPKYPESAELRLAKHRHGMTGNRTVEWHGPTNVFRDPPLTDEEKQTVMA